MRTWLAFLLGLAPQLAVAQYSLDCSNATGTLRKVVYRGNATSPRARAGEDKYLLLVPTPGGRTVKRLEVKGAEMVFTLDDKDFFVRSGGSSRRDVYAALLTVSRRDRKPIPGAGEKTELSEHVICEETTGSDGD